MTSITVTMDDQHLSRAIAAVRFQYENCIQAMYEADQLGHGKVVDSLEQWADSLRTTFEALRSSVDPFYQYYEYVVGDVLASPESVIEDHKVQLARDARIAREQRITARKAASN